MRPLALFFAFGAASGCFYVDTINQRPSIEILNTTPGMLMVVPRGGMVSFRAVKNDPEDLPDAIRVAWEVNACVDAKDFTTCDQTPFFTSIEDDVTFMVPKQRVEPDPDNVIQPVQSLRILLTATDSHGAQAKPDQVLALAVSDAFPVITQLGVSKGFGKMGGHVIGTTVDITADYFDDDDPIDQVVLDWKAFSPTQTMFALQDLGTMPGTTGNHRQSTVRLLPPVTGDWTVNLTLTDPLQHVATDHVTITVLADAPPCLEQLSPIVPQTGEPALPVTSPTLFQVPLVADDLDRYPPPANPQLGTTRFAWSILPPTGPRTIISGVTGNSIAFDPATYPPGSTVELRVEIFDRKNTPINCADALATCSVNATTCLQRQTWRLEVQ